MTNYISEDDEIYQKLVDEFKSLKSYRVENLKRVGVNAVVVLSAEETDISGENKERVEEGFNISESLKIPLYIFLGTRAHNYSLRDYIKERKIITEVLCLNNRLQATTRTQIKDLSIFLKKNPKLSLLIVSHAYHIPRIKRYCQKYMSNIHYDFAPIGSILEQSFQIKTEINKIIRYSKQEDLPLYLN